MQDSAHTDAYVSVDTLGILRLLLVSPCSEGRDSRGIQLYVHLTPHIHPHRLRVRHVRLQYGGGRPSLSVSSFSPRLLPTDFSEMRAARPTVETDKDDEQRGGGAGREEATLPGSWYTALCAS